METTQIYPEPDSGAGWSYLTSVRDTDIRAGMNRAKLDQLFELQDFLFGGQNQATVIIRKGEIVCEHASFMGLATSRFDIWSGTKSLTGSAWGMLIDDSRNGKLPGRLQIDLDTRAYQFLPESTPLSDTRKNEITIGQLLSMTSGIKGEDHGLYGVPTAAGTGPFEHALGFGDNRYGRSAALLATNPGSGWDYSDPAFAHLSLLFSRIAGIEMNTYLQERLFEPIGVEHASFSVLGGAGFMGPHTCGHVGLIISARDLARFGLLVCRNGRWKDEQIIPRWWCELATRSSQPFNPEYGYSWWVNTTQTRWPALPADAFALQGHNTNCCYVIPSLDLVVVKIGSGPTRWNEGDFITGVIECILE
ncbi:serine hydrolase [Chromatiales bacterium (ex Bugula neritina AB1)]|nr:serine hydrolase [Chromatiales bacterium (ex Bugula neritina AB1)]